MVNRIFDKKNVILFRINEEDLNSFLVDMDIDDNGESKYCLDDFTKAICNTIPEYVFAQYEDPNIPQNDIVEKLREAAHCIYKIKDFQLMKQWCVDKDVNAYNKLKKSSTAKRGEFGELLLHLILREFKHTIPLISKVFLKIVRMCLHMDSMRCIFPRMKKFYGLEKVNFMMIVKKE